ncbi:GPI-GlcNAc transferase complex, PIG-H component-domain-containing protein [Gongronella butleri]|nr:GPI-GlcNAc transferase complex, PIG-H component-domain-containing protein [Gongronella butleri]
MTARNDGKRTHHSEYFSSHILPGGHTHEYVTVTRSSLLSPLDLAPAILIGLMAVTKGWDSYWMWLACFLWVWSKLRRVKRESLLVMQNIGIQVKTAYWSGQSTTKFIHGSKIQDIIINEGITLWQVKPYLAILVKDEPKMTIVFANLLPPLNPDLLVTYRGTRALLFPSANKI